MVNLYTRYEGKRHAEKLSNSCTYNKECEVPDNELNEILKLDLLSKTGEKACEMLKQLTHINILNTHGFRLTLMLEIDEENIESESFFTDELKHTSFLYIICNEPCPRCEIEAVKIIKPCSAIADDFYKLECVRCGLLRPVQLEIPF